MQKRPRKFPVRMAAIAGATALGALALGWLTLGAPPSVAQSASSPAAAPAAGGPDAALIQRGEYLAKAGDCIACHTAPGGKPFAGGFKMVTPMGAIYATNITPDPETGIGKYTEQDFDRAVREGVAKEGHTLYPAMPFPSYAKVRQEDIKAMYAYFMHGVEPVRQANLQSEIPWPLNMRWPLKFWNMVFLDKTPYKDDPQKDAVWNRGAYLVQGLGHCGACHTPRGVGFQEKALSEKGKPYLTGAVVEHWFASNLTGDPNVGLGRWSEQDVVEFMGTGANRHASAFGGMVSVINHSLQEMTPQDLTAMARYLKSLPGVGGNGSPPYAYDGAITQTSLRKPAGNAGAKVYATYCMYCHGADGRAYSPLLSPLAGNPNVIESNPVSLINVTLNGSDELVIKGMPSPYPMPKFAEVLSDQEIADVLTFIRQGWNNKAGAVTEKDVAKIRKATGQGAD
ncbi:mono/diheme cytochrome c family protein [Cupriavidus plantarum]|nr:c-type cytochrome [Cupriavidus plantarum]NYI00264.1 mono/diheme cytochrome c family protein [Cupriavidus plantarum]REE89171.1 mono/diheme cytochrome c family protein [Cupriavidus plantarum]